MYNHYIDTFLCVAQEGSFNKASEKMNLSTPSVRNHIEALERSFSVPLLERSNNGVKLTAAGQYFYVECQKIINMSADLINRTNHITKDRSRIIRLGISPINPLERFNQIWKSSPLASMFTLELVSFSSNINTEVPTSKTDADTADFGFAAEASLEYFVETVFLPFDSFRLTCAVPAAHPLAKKKKLSLSDLSEETLLFPYRGLPLLAHRFSDEMKKNHPDIQVDLQPLFYDLDLFNRCAENGTLLISLECWDELHPGMVNLPVDWDWHMPFGLIWKKDSRKEVLEFAEAFRKALETFPEKKI